MIKLTYEQIIQKIIDVKKLPRDMIEKKVEGKMNQLSGLVSKEGAAHIVANEIGVKLFDEITGRMKINKVLVGMRSVEVVGKVSRKWDVKEFTSARGPGKVGRMTLQDETGYITIVLWNDQTSKLAEIQEGNIVKVTNAYSRENNNYKELHLNDKSKIEINPAGEVIGETKITTERKSIKDLKEGDFAELLGTIVQAFEPRFFEVCPECKKRVRPENNFECKEHGHVTPDYGYVLSIVLDDGTENIRCSFFNENVLSLLEKNKEEVLKFKDAIENFIPLKNDLLGTIVKVLGKAAKNQMFDRLEMRCNKVDVNPNPDDELKRLDDAS